MNPRSACSARIEQLGVLGRHMHAEAPHRLREAGDLLHCLALDPQSGKERTDLRLGGGPFHDDAHNITRLLPC
ncbi:hypothetical protein D3C71_1297500 [compost metagenome]